MTSAVTAGKPTQSFEKACVEELQRLSLNDTFLMDFEDVTERISSNIERLAKDGGPSLQLVRAYDEALGKFGTFVVPVWAHRIRMSLLGVWVRAGCPLH